MRGFRWLVIVGALALAVLSFGPALRYEDWHGYHHAAPFAGLVALALQAAALAGAFKAYRMGRGTLFGVLAAVVTVLVGAGALLVGAGAFTKTGYFKPYP